MQEPALARMDSQMYGRADHTFPAKMFSYTLHAALQRQAIQVIAYRSYAGAPGFRQ